MTRFMLSLTLIAALCLLPISVKAQTRVFVAAQGSDSNSCTFATPCRTFQHAHDVVAAGGEIDVLDPAGYGSLTITKAISIQGHGFSGISAAGGGGITINAGASDTVSLRGLLIDGVGTGTIGIYFHSGAALHVEDSVIRKFGTGVRADLEPGSAPTHVYLSDTVLADNADGIFAFPGADGLYMTLSRMELSGNTRAIRVFATNLPLHKSFLMSVSDSVIAGTGQEGIRCENDPAVNSFVTVVVTRSSIVDGAGTALLTIGTGTVIELNATTVANNASGWSTSSGGAFLSWGNNSFSDVGASGDGALPLRSPI